MRTVAIFLVVIAAGASSLRGQDLALPASTCTLRYSRVDEALESLVMKRWQFDGCLSFKSDPLADFVWNPSPEVPCALELQHFYDPESRLRFWIYESEEGTRFNDEVWNLMITQLLSEYPETQYSCEFLRPFKEGRDAGMPVLGYVPLIGELSILIREDSSLYWNFLCVVPAPESNRIVVICLQTSDNHKAYMKEAYRGFLKSLYY